MGSLDEFSTATRLFLKAYRWRRIDPVPWTPLRVPLAQARVALVSSAGFTAPGQPPFDGSRLGGDPSFRAIGPDADLASLENQHRSESFDHGPMLRDPNVAFPLDRLRELAARKRIGALAPRHLSFMGSITAPGRLAGQTAPEAAQWLVDDAVDAALLVPV